MVSRIVITGASGNIATFIIKDLLKLNYEIIGIDIIDCEYNIPFTKISLNDPDIIKLIKQDDIVIHLGAISCMCKNQHEPQNAYYNNVVGTLNLLEACRIVGVKHFIFSSTVQVYENLEPPFIEDNILTPNLIYSLGKKHCEDLIRSYNEIYKLPYTILRFFNVYGQIENTKQLSIPLIPYLIKMFRNGEQPILYSTGYQKRDYIYIKDLLHFVRLVITSEPKNTTVNVASGNAVSVREIVSSVQKFLNCDINPIYKESTSLWDKKLNMFNGVYTFSDERMNKEINKYTLGDIKKSQELYGWIPKYNLDTGINDMFLI
jgi:UDP-glucose 4-epimerase